MRKLFYLVLLASLLPVVESRCQVPDSIKTEGIWFRSVHTLPGRFLYSQTILWPSSIAAHTYMYVKEDIQGDFDWSKVITLRKYQRTFTLPPVWDSDHWSWNYEVHPIMGSFSYLAYRNRQAPWYEAFAGSAVNSAIYEYLIAGGTQQPSYNDMIVTPILGSLLGEGIYQFKKWVLRDHHLKTWEKIAITITDPFEAFYYGFDYKKIIRAKYR